MDNNQSKIAILIDAENVSYKNTDQIIETMENKGKILVKVVVADWTRITGAKTRSNGKYEYRSLQIDGWRKEASKHSMTAVQQFSYVAGKNTSDIAMTIQAMKILYEKPYITTFCLVSNDSDFTRLAQELREQNKEVIGMGERDKAIKEFVNAFSEFVYLGESIEEDVSEKPSAEVSEKPSVEATENQKSATQKSAKQTKKPSASARGKKTASKPILDDEMMQALKSIVADTIEESEEGVAYYSAINSKMKRRFADFVPANYECKNISQLMAKLLPFLSGYEEYKEPIPNNSNGFIYMLRKTTVKSDARKRSAGGKKKSAKQ